MNKQILVIEDEKRIRNDLSTALKLSGYKTILAEDGYEGYELAQKNMPDLIICDIMMPEVDGYEVLEKIQSNINTSYIPFLFLTAKSSKNNIRSGMTSGADDYITKPYDIDELLEAVGARLKKSENIKHDFNQQINSLKTSVSRSLPHETRTPINIILGMSEFLMKNMENTEKDDVLEMLQNINDAGKRLHRLFENYLFYANLEIVSRSSEEKQKIISRSTTLTKYLIKDLAMGYAKRNGRFDDITIDLTDSTAQIDENYLSKIVEELLDNAIKFSEDGSEIILKTQENEDTLDIMFKDHGRGMTEPQINEIDAYVQFDRKFYEQQGTGLGLAIVRKIIDIHNGNLKIKSSLGEFTEIIVTLPLSE